MVIGGSLLGPKSEARDAGRPVAGCPPPFAKDTRIAPTRGTTDSVRSVPTRSVEPGDHCETDDREDRKHAVPTPTAPRSGDVPSEVSVLNAKKPASRRGPSECGWPRIRACDQLRSDDRRI